ncbi:MAG: HEAT repeat domain-containing protein [Candidatus Brocadiaceae bacterium]|nr:HEAT repeat domain-containing protein [Candidatus Brocadiaceae bacterium]
MHKKISCIIIICVILVLSFPVITLASLPLGLSAKDLITIINNSNNSPNVDIVKRMEAQKGLVQMCKQNDHIVIPLIIAELEKPHSYDNKILQQRIALIETLSQIGPAAEPAVGTLINILDDKNQALSWTHFAIEIALGKIGVYDPKREQRDLDRLNEWQNKASPEDIVRAVKEHSFFIRKELRIPEISEAIIEASVRVLMSIGKKAHDASPTLLRAYNDQRISNELHDLLRHAINVIGKDDIELASSPEPPDIVEEIITDVREADDVTIAYAIKELIESVPHERAVDELIKNFLKTGRMVCSVANGLQDIEKLEATRAVPYLLPYISDSICGANVIQALSKLGQKGDIDLITALRNVLMDAKSPLHGQAAAALGNLQATAAVPDLVSILNSDEGKYTKILTINALQKIGGEAAIEASPNLTSLLQVKDYDIQYAVICALGSFRYDVAVPALSPFLHSSNSRVKQATYRALENIGNDQAKEALIVDAKRYKESDKQQARFLYNKQHKLGEFIRSLPKYRSIQLAQCLIDDEKAPACGTVCVVLIKEDITEEVIPCLAEIISSDRAEYSPQNLRCLRLIKIETTSEQFINMLLQIDNYFKEHYKDYNAEKRSRIDNFSQIAQMLYYLKDGRPANVEETLLPILVKAVVNGNMENRLFGWMYFDFISGTLTNEQQQKTFNLLIKFLQDNKHNYNTEQQKNIEAVLHVEKSLK